MDRRESIKSILLGSMATGTFIACDPAAPEADNLKVTDDLSPGKYGRTEKEKLRDKQIINSSFLTESEIDTLATLCDLILPEGDGYSSASSAGVPEFLEFIVKDMPNHQLPIRGGLMWLDNFANESYQSRFISLSMDQQKALLDQIAFPEEADPSLSQGVKFFSLVRNLTLTGFYTSEIGVKELGYAGNMPNVWDGVPQEVLDRHGMSNPSWISKCVDQEKRMDLAQWDDDGNLIS